MYNQSYKQVKTSSAREAIAKSGLRIGQSAIVSDLLATGNVNGQWTVHPTFEVIEDEATNDNPYTARELWRQVEEKGKQNG